MARYVTEYGTIVEADPKSAKPGWVPAHGDEVTPAAHASDGADIGGALATGVRSAFSHFSNAMGALPAVAGELAHQVGLTEHNDWTPGALHASSVAEHAGDEGGFNMPSKALLASQAEEAARHPIAETAGGLAGTLAGSAPLAILGGAATGGVTRALGGGLAARLGGAAIGEGIAGGAFSLADAAQQAEEQKRDLDGQHALAAGGLGFLLAGGLSFVAKGLGEAAGAAGRKLGGLRRGAEELAPEFAPEAAGVARATDDIAGAAIPSKAATMEADTAAFPRQTRYARGQRDMAGSPFGDTDLPLGGKPGSDLNPEELRSALNAESINSANRTAKVNKLLEIVPEGAHPDWVLGMSKDQRTAMAEFVGVPEASDVTWQALADAVADREGVQIGSTLPKPAPPPSPTMPGMPPPMAQELPGAAAHAAPSAVASPARKAWEAVLTKALTHVAKHGIGKFAGGLLGFSHGPVGAMIGAGIGTAVDAGMERLAASGAISAMATRGAALAGKAVDGALALGSNAAVGSAAKIARMTPTMVFLGNHDTPEDAYAARSDELQALAANNGEGIRNKVSEAFGPLAASQPGAVVQAQQTADRGVQYLLSKLPQAGMSEGSLTPVSDTFTVPRAELASFARVYAAVMQPKTVLADIVRGTVTSDQIDAVKAVYPAWYETTVVDAYGEKLRARDAQGRRLMPGATRVANTVLGTSAGIDSAELGLRFGDKFTPKPGPAKPHASGAGLNAKNQSPTDKILER